MFILTLWAQVEVLREELAAIKNEENEKKERMEENKKVLMEHREKLQAIIATCKALHEGFDEKRREVRAEKQKKIRELTCPDHAWGASPEKSPSPDPFDSPSFEKPAQQQQDSFARQDTFGGQDAFAQQDSFGGQDAFAKQDSFGQEVDAFAQEVDATGNLDDLQSTAMEWITNRMSLQQLRKGIFR